MRFVFTRLFYVLLAAGFVPLSLSWDRPVLRWATVVYDLLLFIFVVVDYRISRMPEEVRVEREIEGRFHLGAETEVRVRVSNSTRRDQTIILKDEYPPEMRLTSLREARLGVEAQTTPNSVTDSSRRGADVSCSAQSPSVIFRASVSSGANGALSKMKRLKSMRTSGGRARRS